MTERLFDDEARRYDALLVVSFGGPEAPEDVLPFLDNVLRGRDVPAAAKARAAERYARFGGVSPINAHTRAFVRALRTCLRDSGLQLPVYWGNRNWKPMLEDTLRRMAADGVRDAIAFVTSSFSSYSGCRQYREDLHRAAAALDAPPRIDKLRQHWNHPGFVDAVTDRVRTAFNDAEPDAALLFTAHSLPVAMAACADYEAQLREACGLVANNVGVDCWRLAYQSASGGRQPWLQPNVETALRQVRDDGHAGAVVVPIGFVCDHLEVVLDLDVEARRSAAALGVEVTRAATVGTHPAYVGMVRDLVVERCAANPRRPSLGVAGPMPDFCAASCCLSGAPGPALPALCGAE